MTVEELFTQESIETEFIDEHFDSKYWEGCSKFVNENWTADIDEMSPKQGAWLTKILDDCVEKRIEG